MKKVLCLLVVFCLALGLIACDKATEGLKYEFKEYYGTYAVYIGENRALEKIVIPSKYEGKLVTEIGYYAFSNCYNLTKITIPDSVIILGDSAFSDCPKLTSITLPKELNSIGTGAFRNCINLKKIAIPKNVTKIGAAAFAGCTNITEIKMPNGLTEISESAFSGCVSLENIAVPDSVISIGNNAFENTAWYNKQPDGMVYINEIAYKYKGSCPETIAIKEGTKSISEGAFKDCYSLKNITIPNSITHIDDQAFAGCINLESIVIPEGVTTIGHRAFDGCSKLKNIVIPKSVTKIKSDAFAGCKRIENITILNSEIEMEYIFDAETEVDSITFGGTREQWEKISNRQNIYFWRKVKTVHCSDGDIIR